MKKDEEGLRFEKNGWARGSIHGKPKMTEKIYGLTGVKFVKGEKR
jgi:hypothetical protein